MVMDKSEMTFGILEVIIAIRRLEHHGTGIPNVSQCVEKPGKVDLPLAERHALPSKDSILYVHPVQVLPKTSYVGSNIVALRGGIAHVIVNGHGLMPNLFHESKVLRSGQFGFKPESDFNRSSQSERFSQTGF
jgi:hypothetical protein